MEESRGLLNVPSTPARHRNCLVKETHLRNSFDLVTDLEERSFTETKTPLCSGYYWCKMSLPKTYLIMPVHSVIRDSDRALSKEGFSLLHDGWSLIWEVGGRR